MKGFLAFLKRSIPIFIMILLVVAVFVAGEFVKRGSDVYLKEVNYKVQSLGSDADKLNRTYTQLLSDVNSVSTLNNDRVNKDDELMKQLIDRSFNWSSAVEYREIRKNILNTYGVAVSGFLNVFMPESIKVGRGNGLPPEAVKAVGFETFTSYVTNVLDNKYSYMAEVSLKIIPLDGSAPYNVPCVVFYTIDGGGKFLNTSAYLVDA